MLIHPVLILDDHEHWLALHERRLKNAGIDCHATQNSSEAIDWAIQNKIKVALIDEILFVPSISNSQEGELQRWQGKGVIRKIVEAGLIHTYFIFITDAPAKRSGWNTPGFLQEVFLQEIASLRRISGVINVINKSEIESSPEDSYAHLIDIIQRVNRSDKNSSQLVQTESWQGNFYKRLALIRININLTLFKIGVGNIGVANVKSKIEGDQIGQQDNQDRQ
ncbi:response regulator [Nostoc parmelioides]|uniref:Response regulator n=1 Tax=Nostoc parmelioides FACHB-3921 TaxID=2692909 RepID=A0ABR8BNP4_9NOSO|nr:response regulator [Nostoc parmelioides]MBD2254441.1 response regulator [Nostoc parmelioides FACHB-3921]